jgi:hypothetical protein
MAGGGGEQLGSAERLAIANLLDAIHRACTDPRVGPGQVWALCGQVAATCQIASGDVRRGGRGYLIDGAAARLFEMVDELAARQGDQEGGEAIE